MRPPGVGSIHSEVNYETQCPIGVPECLGGRVCLREAAIHRSQLPEHRLVHHGSGRTGRFVQLELDVERSRGSEQPGHASAAGFIQQRYDDSAAAGLEHSAEVGIFAK